MAEKKGCTPAQLSLGWVCALGDKVIPIPSASCVSYHHLAFTSTADAHGASQKEAAYAGEPGWVRRRALRRGYGRDRGDSGDKSCPRPPILWARGGHHVVAVSTAYGMVKLDRTMFLEFTMFATRRSRRVVVAGTCVRKFTSAAFGRLSTSAAGFLNMHVPSLSALLSREVQS